MNWEDVEEFCSDCIMKDANICPCDDIAENICVCIVNSGIKQREERD